MLEFHAIVATDDHQGSPEIRVVDAIDEEATAGSNMGP
jgi:hypothetical protein